MAFINGITSFGIKSELDLFTSKPLQGSIESGTFVEYRPIATIVDPNSPLEFVINGDDSYIDLANCKLEIRVKLLHEDGQPLEEKDTACPINNFLDTLFEHVSIDLNGHTVTPPSNLYHYRSMIETLLSYSREAQSTHLSAGLFCKDDSTKMDDVKGVGFQERKKYLKNGIVELSSYIHADLMCQDKFLIGGVTMRLKFFRNKTGFILLKAAEDLVSYRVDIVEAVLLIRKVKVNPSIMIAHEKALTKANIKYPINRVEVKSITVSKDTQTKSLDNVIIGMY